jgi:putative NADPH-quinone reductase
MKINIYYGGRGLIEDPTLYVISKMTSVLEEELRVKITRYNLYEEKNTIAMLPKTLKEADGIILATTVEWFGIGGLMQQFLDACWLYGDKDRLSKLYMLPVVMATTYGERDAELTLVKAWEMLGGIPPYHGICAYVEDHVDFETNPDFTKSIEDKAESFYRIINQKWRMMPVSNTAIKQNLLQGSPIVLTPQESEQLSMYVSDDAYVKKQKEDIEELTLMFKEMLDSGDGETGQEFIKNLKDNFHPLDDFVATYAITLSDVKKTLVVEINNKHLKCYYGEKPDAEVIAKTTHNVMNRLVLGRITFQGAFMSGELTAKGNFKTLRTFDQVFQFNIL